MSQINLMCAQKNSNTLNINLAWALLENINTTFCIAQSNRLKTVEDYCYYYYLLITSAQCFMVNINAYHVYLETDMVSKLILTTTNIVLYLSRINKIIIIKNLCR